MTSRINPDDEIRIDWHRVGRCDLHDKQIRDNIDSLVAEDKAMNKAIDENPNAFLPFDDDDPNGSTSSGKGVDERDSYYKAMREQRFAPQLVGGWLLPAHGSNGKDSCGQFIPKGCLNSSSHSTGSNYQGMYTSSCGSIGCNKCFESSIQKQAFKTSIRLTGLALNMATEEVYRDYNSQNKLSHIAISVPPNLRDELLTEEGEKKHTKNMHEIQKIFHLHGSEVFHPYRFTENLKSIKEFSPHWHILAIGWVDGKVCKLIEAGAKKEHPEDMQEEFGKYEYNYEKYKGYNVLQMSVVDTRKKIYNVIAYQLSHVGIKQKESGQRSSKQTVKYVGKANPRYGKYTSVLSNSESAYDQLNNLFKGRQSKVVRGSEYTLSHVSLSVVTYDSDIKKASREYKWFDDGKISSVESFLRGHVTPRMDLMDDPDYYSMCDFGGDKRRSKPALTECDTEDKFICIRLDYHKGNDRSLLVSDYISVFFDPSLSLLCPECSCKIRPLKMNVNNIDYQDNFCEETLPMMVEQVGKLFPCQTTNGFEYLTKQNMSPLGMQYFTKEKMDYSNGRYTKPECFDKLNPLLQKRIEGCIEWQFNAPQRKEAKRQEWIKNNEVHLGRGIAKPVVTSSAPKRVTGLDSFMD